MKVDAGRGLAEITKKHPASLSLTGRGDHHNNSVYDPFLQYAANQAVDTNSA
ncbi:Uncharacterised protein [Yersinia mollaretii]|nr:Uncharacterised protein [Yersinia mollaretii]